MLPGQSNEGGFQSKFAFPLIIGQEARRAVYKYMLDRNISEGKALNELINRSLIDLGYIQRSSICKHTVRDLRLTAAGYGPYYHCKECGARVE